MAEPCKAAGEIEMKALSTMFAASALLLCSCSDNGASSPAASGNASASNAGDVVPDVPPPANTGNGASDTPAQIVSRLFQSSDLNHSGMLTGPEAAAYMNLVLISQDTDEDGRLNLTEFQAWDVGFSAIADAKGTSSKYAAAKATLFKSWDANGDGYLTFQERDTGISKDFASVPTAEGRRMSPDEFATVPFIRNLAAATA